MLRSRTFIATPPGATIHEELVARELNQKDLALHMKLSEEYISKLINGEVPLSSDVADSLEKILNIPAKFWLRLEEIYQDKLSKVKAEIEMDSEIELIKKIPYKEMMKNGWIPKTSTIQETVLYLRKFFEVDKLNLVFNLSLNTIACRRLSSTEKSDIALITWVQKAKIEARSIQTGEIDLKALSNQLESIRQMTRLEPTNFTNKLKNILSDCGIALVFLPHINGSFLHGATFYDGDKIVIGLTVRGKDADKFWFSLFHELGHIILGHINNPNGTSDADENEADSFAKEHLISKKDYFSFISKNVFTEESIITFSNTIGIDCGIVVGRLQKEGYIPYSWYNNLKTKYVLK